MLKKYLAPVLLAGMALLLPSQASAQQAGTTLQDPSKTATAVWEHRIGYDWTIEKSASPLSFELGAGDTQTVNYTLTATKTQVSDVEVSEVSGTICVLNGGERATEGLVITDVIQYKVGSGQFQDLLSTSVDVSSNPILDPLERGCYPYSIEFTPVAGAQYRNEANIDITNHSGQLGELFGTQVRTDFSLPAEATLVETDEAASLADVLTCPTGFTCQSSFVPGTLTASEVVTYTVDVTNDSAACSSSFSMDNTASLTELDSQTVRTDSVSVGIMTEACPVSTACTYTQGYWKNHQEAWAETSLDLGNRTYTQTELLEIFNTSVKGNGLVSLAHQLIAAKLNEANGTTDPGAATAIAAADSLIGGLVIPPIGSDKLSSKVTTSLTGQLDAFNNGLMGPAHCD